MIETICGYLFYAVSLFFLSVLAFGPYLLGMTDKRKKQDLNKE
jgi:hypothetical protein